MWWSRLLDLLQDYGSVVSRIPPALLPLMQPFIVRVEAALSPGLTTLSWTALNSDACKQRTTMSSGFHSEFSHASLPVSVLSVIENVYVVLKVLDQVSKVATDLLECRIGRLLQAVSSCSLLVLPEDRPVSPQELLLQTDGCVRAAAATLTW